MTLVAMRHKSLLKSGCSLCLNNCLVGVVDDLELSEENFEVLSCP